MQESERKVGKRDETRVGGGDEEMWRGEGEKAGGRLRKAQDKYATTNDYDVYFPEMVII